MKIDSDNTTMVIITVILLTFTICILCVSHTLEVFSCKGNITCIDKLNKPLFQSELQVKEIKPNVK